MPARVPAARLTLYAALLVAGLTFAVSIRSGLFVAGGSDSSGYLSAAELWRSGQMMRSEPLHFWAAGPNASAIGMPLGYREGPIRGTEVSSYPPGFPLTVAAATAIGGRVAGHLVSPLMAGVLVLATFLVARASGGALAGLVAATLVATSPELLMHSVQAMSDAPAAACWVLAWWFALRASIGGGAAAGSLAALAILTRPNLAPLAAVIGLTILIGDRRASDNRRHWRWLPSFVFAGMATLGVVTLMWSQAALYGSPFAPSYPQWSTVFSTSHITANMRIYPRLFGQAHTLWPLTGVLMLVAAAWTTTGSRWHADRRVVLSAGGLAAVNVLLYLPYFPFDHWPFLRFLLPGIAAVFVLFATLVAIVTRAAWAAIKWPALLVPALLVPIVLHGRPLVAYALNDWRAQSNVRLMGHYLHETLPPNAAVLAFTHTGAVAYYTGRDIVRLDLIEPSSLDRIVDDLASHGYRPVFVLDQLLEAARFKEHFAASRYGALDWPARARFVSVSEIWYFDAADRAAYLQGARWPVDTVR